MQAGMKTSCSCFIVPILYSGQSALALGAVIITFHESSLQDEGSNTLMAGPTSIVFWSGDWGLQDVERCR